MNPFSLSFGKKPAQFISRLSQTKEVLDAFLDDAPSTQIYMITGVRGSGKTVMLTTISHSIAAEKEWICMELNPTKDLLQGFAAKLYSIPELQGLFVDARLNLSAFGIGLSLANTVPIADIETAIERMLKVLKKHGKKLLITIDEATNNEYMRIFASSFQIFMRQEYPVYLLMTGLFENIQDLQDDRSLTFLYRAPKIRLAPLNYTAVMNSYKTTFQISDDQARRMATLTKGYPFAFQVLGYLYWNNRADKTIDQILPIYDQYLEEYVYEKIWSEMSEMDRKVVVELSAHGSAKTKDIREKLHMSSSAFSVYRDRLKKKGIVDTSEYGKLSLILPRFAEYAQSREIA